LAKFADLKSHCCGRRQLFLPVVYAFNERVGVTQIPKF
jgi:hypothetical protein